MVVGSVVFRGLSARDLDSNVNGQVEFFIDNEDESAFEIALPHQVQHFLKFYFLLFVFCFYDEVGR
jgi:hypothetical protein